MNQQTRQTGQTGQTGQNRQDIDIDKNPNFVSYADMLKRPKEIQPEAHPPKDPEKFVKLTKKSNK